ncbi:MAG: hypothetical protein LUE26_00785 [Alistipes sp.]|nr:hypothetical protein [Alistipes sp.]
MKNRLLGAAVALIVAPILITSCDMLGGIVLKEEGSGVKLQEKLTKEIDPEAIVYNIVVNSEDDFSFKAGSVIIYYSEPGSDEVKATTFNFATSTVNESSNTMHRDRTPDTGIALKDIDFASISLNMNNAIDWLSKNDIKSDGFKQYRIFIVSSNPEDVYYRFEINQKGKTTTVGNRRQTEYFEYKFKADSDGELELLD